MADFATLEKLRAAARLPKLKYEAEVAALFEQVGPCRPPRFRQLPGWPKNNESIGQRLERLEVRGLARRYTELRGVTAERTEEYEVLQPPLGFFGTELDWHLQLYAESTRTPPLRRGSSGTPFDTYAWSAFWDWRNSPEGIAARERHGRREVRTRVVQAYLLTTTYWDRGLEAREWDERQAPWLDPIQAAVAAGATGEATYLTGVYADWLEEKGFWHESQAARSWYAHGRPLGVPKPMHYGAYRDNHRERAEVTALLAALRPDVARYRQGHQEREPSEITVTFPGV